jgi:nucleolar protein 6
MLSRWTDRGTPTPTNDIDADLAPAPSLKLEICGERLFFVLEDLTLFEHLPNCATTSDLRRRFHHLILLRMSDPSAKKRKRAHADVEDPDPQHLQKTRIVEDAATDAGIPSSPAVKRSTKDGKSRQEKSERRSSKKQKKIIADISPAEEADGDHFDPKPERAHKKHKKAKVEERDVDKVIGNTVDEPSGLSSKQPAKETVDGEPPAKSSHSSVVPAPTNDSSLPVTNGTDKTRRIKKSHTKVATTADVEDEVTPNDSTIEGQNNSKPQRFILFIGNLPYSATTPQIESHFSKLAPTSIRHSTDKSTGRSKGFAFLEFAGYDKMKTCLKLYHHSIFDPDDSNDDHDKKRKDKKKPGRRINVELTVGGGGGRSEKRKEKIKGKNLKLEEERERRRVKELEDGEKEAKKKPKNPATDANATLQTEKENDMRDIHPSRRGRVG